MTHRNFKHNTGAAPTLIAILLTALICLVSWWTGGPLGFCCR